MALTYTYTTQAEMESIFGTESTSPVELRLDDDGDLDGSLDAIEASALADVIEEASHEINFHLAQRYTPVVLNAHSWVRRACSIIACYLLSQRRGDPAQYTDAYTRVITRLEEIFAGKRDLPLTADRHPADQQPALSNLVVSDRYGRKKLRVQEDVSEGGTDGSQHLDHVYYFDP